MSPDGRTGSPASPAVERKREQRANSWAWNKVKNLMSPAFGSFKRYSPTAEEHEGEMDEEAALGVNSDEESERGNARFSDDDEQGGVGTVGSRLRQQDDAVDEEAGTGVFKEEGENSVDHGPSLLPMHESPR